MIDPKYNPQVKRILESRLKRPASPNELANALTDVHVAMELLLELHESNAATITSLVKKVGPISMI